MEFLRQFHKKACDTHELRIASILHSILHGALTEVYLSRFPFLSASHNLLKTKYQFTPVMSELLP